MVTLRLIPSSHSISPSLSLSFNYLKLHSEDILFLLHISKVVMKRETERREARPKREEEREEEREREEEEQGREKE